MVTLLLTDVDTTSSAVISEMRVKRLLSAQSARFMPRSLRHLRLMRMQSAWTSRGTTCGRSWKHSDVWIWCVDEFGRILCLSVTTHRQAGPIADLLYSLSDNFLLNHSRQIPSWAQQEDPSDFHSQKPTVSCPSCCQRYVQKCWRPEAVHHSLLVVKQTQRQGESLIHPSHLESSSRPTESQWLPCYCIASEWAVRLVRDLILQRTLSPWCRRQV